MPDMAKHEVGLRIAHDIPVGNVDVELPIKADGAPLGRIRVSRGGVDWLPSPKSKKRYSLTWAKFDDLMRTQGTEKS